MSINISKLKLLTLLLSRLSLIIGIIAYFVGVLYCLSNTANHSAFSPFTGSLFFLPILFIGCINFVLGHKSKLDLLTIFVGLYGFFLGFLLHYTGKMQWYEYWVKNMDKQYPLAILWLSLYIIFGLVFLRMILMKKH